MRKLTPETKIKWQLAFWTLLAALCFWGLIFSLASCGAAHAQTPWPLWSDDGVRLTAKGGLWAGTGTLALRGTETNIASETLTLHLTVYDTDRETNLFRHFTASLPIALTDDGPGSLTELNRIGVLRVPTITLAHVTAPTITPPPEPTPAPTPTPTPEPLPDYATWQTLFWNETATSRGMVQTADGWTGGWSSAAVWNNVTTGPQTVAVTFSGPFPRTLYIQQGRESFPADGWIYLLGEDVSPDETKKFYVPNHSYGQTERREVTVNVKSALVLRFNSSEGPAIVKRIEVKR